MRLTKRLLLLFFCIALGRSAAVAGTPGALPEDMDTILRLSGPADARLKSISFFVAGLGDTIFAWDVNAAFAPWADPDALRSLKLGVRDEWTGSRRGEVGYGSAHPSGALMLMGDGAIKFVDNEIDARVLEQLGRRRKEDL